jgi:hypothetical protein
LDIGCLWVRVLFESGDSTKDSSIAQHGWLPYSPGIELRVKPRWKIVLGLAGLILLLPVTALFWVTNVRHTAEQTRATLEKDGFKSKFTDFDFSTTVESRIREAAVATACGIPFEHGFPQMPGLMRQATIDSAIVLWAQEKFLVRDTNGIRKDLRPPLQESLNAYSYILDHAANELLSGPLRPDLNARHGITRLENLVEITNLEHVLGTQVLFDLHAGNKDSAWTNLLAATRLVTAFESKLVEQTHLARFALVPLAFNVTWQALQTNCWSDEQLAQLQNEWEATDFFSTLPETAAFSRVKTTMLVQSDRKEPIYSFGWKVFFRNPRACWSSLKHYLRMLHYRQIGTYEDEDTLLLFFRDREIDLRNVAKCNTWLEMQLLPGATSHTMSPPLAGSTAKAAMSWQIMAATWPLGERTLLQHAAVAESLRRVLITAIALERYHRQNGAYPWTLNGLDTRFLKQPPIDFADGKLLRYRLTHHGTFVLYSLGLDGTDDGGVLSKPQTWDSLTSQESQQTRNADTGIDLVWPRPASSKEVEELQRQEVSADAGLNLIRAF